MKRKTKIISQWDLPFWFQILSAVIIVAILYPFRELFIKNWVGDFILWMLVWMSPTIVLLILVKFKLYNTIRFIFGKKPLKKYSRANSPKATFKRNHR